MKQRLSDSSSVYLEERYQDIDSTSGLTHATGVTLVPDSRWNFGANAEFGRTGGGVVNVITKSGTNRFHGSLFEYQRLEALTANTSDGTPLTDFHREQYGGSAGGRLIEDKLFYFGAAEGIAENLQRANLSKFNPKALGTGSPCAISNPVFNSNAPGESTLNNLSMLFRGFEQ